jgi:6-hydroxy-3-succinoylpyridine 3-monooxygenase
MAACLFAPRRAMLNFRMTKRSIIYIDGFNLYYGSVKGTGYKWLDVQRLFERLRPDDDIRAIRYFTALITGDGLQRQLTYLKALHMLPKVDVIHGRFKPKRFRCAVANCTFGGSRFYLGIEEKRTDVAIGVQLVDDAYRDIADRFVLVSGDSDLVPAVRLLKQRFPDKEVIVYVPTRNEVRGAATELRGEADRHRTLPMALVKRSQLPVRLSDGSGGYIEKPPQW